MCSIKWTERVDFNVNHFMLIFLLTRTLYNKKGFRKVLSLFGFYLNSNFSDPQLEPFGSPK